MWSQPCLEGGMGSTKLMKLYGRKQIINEREISEKVIVMLLSLSLV